MTHSRTDITRLLTEIGRRPRQSLGQNFVADANTVRRIVRLAELPAGAQVVEVGAGLGSLTLALLEAGFAVTAIEIDGDLVSVLQHVAEPRGARVVHADAMTVDWSALLGPGDEAWHLVANLPYNIATPLVADLLDTVPRIKTMLVMVQHEVAARLVARVGDAAYGIPSVKVAYWATARIVGRVPATVFVPKPRVESSLVRIVRRPEPATSADRDLLFSLVRAGFGQRRKMLRRSLGDRVSAAQFEIAGIAPHARAEELSVSDWGRLASVLAER
ncbi:MAG TPA: 16S rRNA (adenine(1518)-N(6)/adenine(1519)-N(6))-dimethyltransferase RsmA [Acidimicrobiales bacterium]|nr:16S rRNA (adenine(1518)-N(6)/adenine(1519)-N(6))-dimethyltransferase RsmA [Acidimicrobiales bacterium]